MVVECPHCHRRVFPPPSGECPACGKSTTDLTGGDLSVTEITIDDIHQLPRYCIQCGNAAVTTVTLWADRKDPDRSGAAAAQRLQLLYFGGILGLLFARFGLRLGHQRISFKVPVCSSCRRAAANLELRHVDFDQRRATILANVEFKMHLDSSRAVVENQYPETVRRLHPEIERVKDDLRAGQSPAAIANSLHAQGIGTFDLIVIFCEATGASLIDLKRFGQWWGRDGVTDREAFDARAREVLGKR